MFLYNACLSSLMAALIRHALLSVLGPSMANSACAVNLLEESGNYITLVQSVYKSYR